MTKSYFSKKFHPIAKKRFTECGKFWHYSLAVAKSTAERGNSNNEHMANSNTPLNRVIFVCSTSTSKENTAPKNRESGFLSMVACSGKGIALCCVPYVAVFHPVTSYRQAVESKAIVPNNQHMELLAMLYKFLFTGSRLRITVFANNLAEAYTRLPLSQSKPVLIARLPVQGGIYA